MRYLALASIDMNFIKSSKSYNIAAEQNNVEAQFVYALCIAKERNITK
jgi:hypothetical protein